MNYTLEESPRWFVLRDLKPCNSKRPAYKVLTERGLDVFTPMHWKVAVAPNGKRQRFCVPYVHDLLFIRGKKCELDAEIQSVERLQYRYRKGMGREAVMVVPDEDMNRFITAVRTDDTVLYYTPSELTSDMIGRRVLVVGGPLDGYEGRLLKMQGSKKRRLIVNLDGFISAAVEVMPDYLRILP